MVTHSSADTSPVQCSLDKFFRRTQRHIRVFNEPMFKVNFIFLLRYVLIKQNLTGQFQENGSVFHLHHSSIDDLVTLLAKHLVILILACYHSSYIFVIICSYLRCRV